MSARRVLVFGRSGPGALFIEGHLPAVFERPILDYAQPLRPRDDGVRVVPLRRIRYRLMHYHAPLPEYAEWAGWGRTIEYGTRGELSPEDPHQVPAWFLDLWVYVELPRI